MPLFRNKIVPLALAAAMTAATAVPSMAAPRGHWHGDRGWGPGLAAGAIVGGILGAATAPLWAPDYGGYRGGYAYYDDGGRYYNRNYYGQNRYSGQIYNKCMVDDGYGRTVPCS